MIQNAPSPHHAIFVRGLAKTFGLVPALRGINLDLYQGEFLALFGPNGAGKTTLIRILSSLVRPTTGTAWVAGFNVQNNDPAMRKKIGVISQVNHNTSIVKAIFRIEKSIESLTEIAQGGTAVGTVINTHPDFGKMVAREITSYTKIKFNESSNHFESQANQDSSVEVSGALKTAAVSISKIANDIRLMGTGPRCGLGELILPPVQPGSSIMPGKVNPVICESMLQVCSQVIANDLAITLGAQGGAFELNVMLPLIAHNLLQSIDILSNATEVFNDKLILGIKVDHKKCEDYIEKSLSMCTILVPVLGYDKTAEIAYEAYESGKTIRELLTNKNILSKDEINKLLDPYKMTNPSK